MTTLKTECNTPTMERRVLAAARASTLVNQLRRTWRRLSADFEHGQWWVTDLYTGAQWSVCDAEGGDAVDGFTFEQVTPGDED